MTGEIGTRGCSTTGLMTRSSDGVVIAYGSRGCVAGPVYRQKIRGLLILVTTKTDWFVERHLCWRAELLIRNS